MLISIVVPCYNEEKVLPLFYQELCTVINQISTYQFEILMINDGSLDLTQNVIREIVSTDKRVRFISFSRNFGKESAIFVGLLYAKGDLVAIMDADLQDPPFLLPQMIDYIEAGYDSVASRRVTRIGEPHIRSFFARLFYKVIKKISNVDMVDGARDFRLMTRQVVDAILSMQEYHRFSKGIFEWIGFKTKWIPYENITRVAGETSWSFWKLFAYAIEGIIAFTVMPLRIASFSGVAFSILAFFYLIFIFLRTVFYGIEVPGYASTVVLILFIGGVQLLSIGILGEYIARIYIEVKQRPLFIIKESNIKELNSCYKNEDL